MQLVCLEEQHCPRALLVSRVADAGASTAPSPPQVMSADRSSEGGSSLRLREAQQQVAALELSLMQAQGEAQALRAEMETQRTRATQLEQLFQQQVSCCHAMLPVAKTSLL